ncbi:TPA: hypothetical protein ACM68Q_002635 [Escherichia coli]|uniref:hypothetical protein n=1 Tax=Salmonella enterica TaxID=28901 RepID=UPI0010ABAD34|nr:hypothetical protein [Salmonella enterica]EGG2139646.1 hypothetical protein [Salmonella enterica]MCB2247961.1 hypothetical protein [Salmonella enterica subsp. diarizonae]HCS4439283.1 hypothetical protein [Salmonella enterica subsp. enterica serovar Newport]
MSNHTVQCPFCFKESRHGAKICTGCHSKIVYGESPVSVALLLPFVAFGLAWLAFSLTGSTPVSVITFFVSCIVLIYKIKKTYADRVLFIQRN